MDGQPGLKLPSDGANLGIYCDKPTKPYSGAGGRGAGAPSRTARFNHYRRERLLCRKYGGTAMLAACTGCVRPGVYARKARKCEFQSREAAICPISLSLEEEVGEACYITTTHYS